MNKQEFEQKIIDMGVSLNDVCAVVGKKNSTPFTLGIYFEDSEWIVYEYGERNDYGEFFRGNENEAFDNFFSHILLRLRFKRYVTRAVSESVICTPKSVVFKYLKKEYNMTEKQLEQAWDYLKHDFHVLNEVKYYVINGDFVPRKYSYKVQGYSAEQLYKTTYLDVLGAFNYLIYLKTDPNKALENLKRGLPTK